MIKKWICIILVVVAALSIGGVVYYNNTAKNDEVVTEENKPVQTPESEKNIDEVPAQTPKSEPAEPETDGDIIQIPVESVKGITSHEAEELCYSIMGKQDEETGFLFSFGTAAAVEKDGKQYYVIRASWLVNNSHMSYIGDFFVSSDGKEVYSGVALPDEYTMGNLIWSK